MGHSMPDKQLPQRRTASLIIVRNHKRSTSGECHNDFNHGNVKAER